MVNSESGAQAPTRETGDDAEGRDGDVARTLSKMLLALDNALACAPAACSAALEAGPLSRTMAAVLANLGPRQSLQVLHRMSVSALPGRHQVLDGLMTSAPNDFGKVIYFNTRTQHRQALLASIFSPARVQALAKACRVLTKETT